MSRIQFPGSSLGGERLEDPRVPGQGDPAPLRGRDPRGQGDRRRRRGGAGSARSWAGAASSRRRSTPADAARAAASSSPRSPRRPRQYAEPDPRHAAGHPRRPAPRASCAQGAGRGDRRHRAGALPRDHPRPRPGQAGLMASAEGGMDIEEVAEQHPGSIFRVAIDPQLGLQPFQARERGLRPRPQRQDAPARPRS